MNNKSVLITGASRGIGRAAAQAFAREGYHLVLTCLHSYDALKELAASLQSAYGISCTPLQADMGIEQDVDRIFSQLDSLDILINNAGIAHVGLLSDMTTREWRRIMAVNLDSCFYTCRAAIPLMLRKHSGKIINICSMMSEFGRETVSAYAAAKGGLKMLTRNIASEYGCRNIQCNGIGPGYIATPQTAPLREKQADGSRHPFDQFIVSKTPAGRWGDPEDLMGPAVFLASDASNFVNGHILYVDGGILAYIGKQP